jgi:DNA-directed RNA polymerase subunit alpha
MLFSTKELQADEIAQQNLMMSKSRIDKLLKTKLVDMDLSVRALNCLKAAEVDTLEICIVQ